MNVLTKIYLYLRSKLFNSPTAQDEKPVTYQKLCSACGKAVVPEVVNYCTRHPDRFQGKIYCKEHQYPFFNNFEALDKQLEKQELLYASED